MKVPISDHFCLDFDAPTGHNESTIGRIWREHGIKPHRVRMFKLSNDPLFVEKLTDIIGLYVSPPEHAVVLSCDEKSQIQALDRTQPGLPMKKGRCGTMTHDYNGQWKSIVRTQRRGPPISQAEHTMGLVGSIPHRLHPEFA